MESVALAKALEIFDDIPQYDDINNWRAGGVYKNETFAGGFFFGIDREPVVDTEIVGQTLSSSITSNSIYSFLNSYYYRILAEFLAGIFNIYAEENILVNIWIKYTINVKDESGNVILSKTNEYKDTDNDVENNDIETSRQSASIQDVVDAQKTAFSLTDISSPTTISAVAIDILTGKIHSVEQAVGSALFGTVESVATQAITGAVAGVLGITSVASIAGLSFGIFSLVQETVEVLSGTDTSFGFGGEIETDKNGNVVTNDLGEPQYTQSVSFTQGIKNTIATTFGVESLGDTFSDFGYSDEQVSSAMEQSVQSDTEDNPQHVSIDIDDTDESGTSISGFDSFVDDHLGGSSFDGESSDDDGYGGYGMDGFMDDHLGGYGIGDVGDVGDPADPGGGEW